MMARAGMGTMTTKAPRLTDAVRVWFNPDLYSRNYFVPGVIANIIMIVTIMLTAMAIVREKEIGTLEAGKRADIAIWDSNLYTVPSEALKDIKCEMTIFDGAIVYKSDRTPITAKMQ